MMSLLIETETLTYSVFKSQREGSEHDVLELKPLHIVYLNLATTALPPVTNTETLTYSVFKFTPERYTK